MEKTDKISAVLSGISGEYFVAAELSRRGYIASITLRNTAGVDILATNGDATKTVAIQVKTNQKDGKKWVLNEKAEAFSSENHYYIFVNLKTETGMPDFHIVPSKDVAKHVKDGHANWLKTPGKKGQKHIDNPIRQFDDVSNKYRSRWELLKLGD